ncbi:uncharacterized protein BP01DRAFT_357200 [Aspergillus saccharolyticus JOP 1030-1]|uniref:Alpha/beta-hydrolase n=1 Tax=Aspergillus saccharolyticus JOP 1030-1 TaxID=1450539 RepID=A0A318ZBT2_9EURO|nr:hypothetical protein BP01DRAFT_357200 [Aspergillus saccharolyticus JOP 1030-1]PYH44856.1 hypothetical protein BP01DRAFT_357200 [Aspergillus saccharolyticus JOP 1030-1]
MHLRFDPEYAEAAGPIMERLAETPKPKVHDISARREGITYICESLFAELPTVPSVEKEEYEFQSYDGYTISIKRFFKKNSESPGPGRPAILHAHGRGMIQGTVDLYSKCLSIPDQYPDLFSGIPAGSRVSAPDSSRRLLCWVAVAIY